MTVKPHISEKYYIHGTEPTGDVKTSLIVDEHLERDCGQEAQKYPKELIVVFFIGNIFFPYFYFSFKAFNIGLVRFIETLD